MQVILSGQKAFPEPQEKQGTKICKFIIEKYREIGRSSVVDNGLITKFRSCPDSLILDFIYFYFERERKARRKRGRETSICERNIDWLPLACPTSPPKQETGSHNPCMFSDGESNQQLFALRADTQPVETHQSRPDSLILISAEIIIAK